MRTHKAGYSTYKQTLYTTAPYRFPEPLLFTQTTPPQRPQPCRLLADPNRLKKLQEISARRLPRWRRPVRPSRRPAPPLQLAGSTTARPRGCRRRSLGGREQVTTEARSRRAAAAPRDGERRLRASAARSSGRCRWSLSLVRGARDGGLGMPCAA